ncbi:MAG TPA: PTS galactitol transporter subunit IIB, partial [Ruminococcaceae bacterium]|nr:PTS galactitol transporter subunit IIB [Oscillospiraceae bacterium]
ACGGAVATSTVAANKVAELCKENGINVEIIQCRISEIKSHLDGVSLVVPTSRIKQDLGVPVISGMPFISGIGEEELKKKILDVLKT